AMTSGCAQSRLLTSWNSSTVKFGVASGTFFIERTASPVRSTVASYVLLSNRFHTTANECRGTGSPRRQANTSCLAGSNSSIDAKRKVSVTCPSRRSISAVRLNSSALSGSSGCDAMADRPFRRATPAADVGELLGSGQRVPASRRARTTVGGYATIPQGAVVNGTKSQVLMCEGRPGQVLQRDLCAETASSSRALIANHIAARVSADCRSQPVSSPILLSRLRMV